MPFDPANLTPSASLNRARIVDLPGVVFEPDVRGCTGYDLLGAHALVAAIRASAAPLGLDPTARPGELLPAFDHCFVAEDPAIRAAARALAGRFGRSLGYFLLMLHRGDAINRVARDDWDDTYWAYWAGVRTIWLGGGIASGHLGRSLRKYASAVLAECGSGAHTLHRAGHSALLPLIGAARSVPISPTEPAVEAAMVLDFGSTAIKRAGATYRLGALAALHPLPPLPAFELTSGSHTEPSSSAELAHRCAEQMIGVIAATWRTLSRSGLPLTPHVVVSLASYVHDGQPLPRQGGGYTALCNLPEAAVRYLSRLLAAQVGQETAISLLHDGSAAARTYAGARRAAVVMLGTALGVGFPSPSAGVLRPIAPGFTIASIR